MIKDTKLLIIICLLVIFAGLSLLWFGLRPAKIKQVVSPIPQVSATPKLIGEDEQVFGIGGEAVLVSKVVDGDTITLEGGQTVRLIGIDTPETKDPRRPVGCFGKEAANKTKELLEGETVVLQKDVSEVDKYNRLLRYVFLSLDGGQLLFVNDYLVREGFAQVLTYPPDIKYNEQLREAEKSAKENKKGLWGSC
ncbi:hypothetical protein A3B45_03105 [Candidatus Daviesbacteria bacterium RIFCSPLOWO2_01_FULL_39_12]|uniref:TNase-like domain-containing protein n=1 Tax=Candidatus Daviesbacteria bacterium RIFCSPLOWO2_01_FULL_39_12 TaxID=1797785 RepID=A0A1F5KSW0_9BACT|nr:MAG: hypothetical protein A3D79_01580 [Candidatus Daviesbacteria bacterium RIFCSPHIGHO2_02_FULL_39_8]OGE44006.1 MAG: hypothetical protein A3B45_03105 [Candidatus Daviesbacteria bacterium RIFCSPLOWO2_01_FULL_39_12]